MNTTQAKYLRERVQQISAQKIRELNDQYPEIPDLSWKDRRQQIANGTAKLRKDAKSYTDIDKAFDFTDPGAKDRQARKNKVRSLSDLISNRARSLVDKIMLGDGDIPVLHEIEAFEKGSV